jgi:uncharacterized protein (DUF302 family)
MPNRLLVAVLISLWVLGQAHAQPEGLVSKPAKYSGAEVVERLDKVLKGAGMTVFALIDHAAAAQQAGLRMPFAQVVVFGNPKGGTPMMLNAPTIAIDLPLKILVWEDAAGKVWVSYNTATYVASRHHLKDMDKMVQGLNSALAKLTMSVVE